MKYGIMAACLSLGVAGASSAVFTNCSVTTTIISVGGLNLCRAELFANFNGPTDTVLNVFNFQAQGGWSSNSAAASGFWHKDNSDYNGGVLSQQYGTWAPQLIGSATLNRPFDSFLLIGGTPGATNTSNADPSWNSGGSGAHAGDSRGWNRPDLVNNGTIGWFNSSPPNNQGRVGVAPNTATQVKLAQFVLSQGRCLPGFSLRLAYNNGAGGGVVFADGTYFCPTPGAIALLGLAGLTRRRRR